MSHRARGTGPAPPHRGLVVTYFTLYNIAGEKVLVSWTTSSGAYWAERGACEARLASGELLKVEIVVDGTLVEELWP